jgi:hypothetical protein
MRQLSSYGIELNVFELGFAQGYKLYNKKCKEANMEKDHSQNQNVSQIVKLSAHS